VNSDRGRSKLVLAYQLQEGRCGGLEAQRQEFIQEMQRRINEHVATGLTTPIPDIEAAPVPEQPGAGSAVSQVGKMRRSVDQGGSQKVQEAVQSGENARRLREGKEVGTAEVPSGAPDVMLRPVHEDLEGISNELVRKHRLLDQAHNTQQRHNEFVHVASIESRLPTTVGFLRPHFHSRRKRVLPLRDVMSTMTNNPRLACGSLKEAEHLLAKVAEMLPDWCQFRNGKGIQCASAQGAQFFWVKHDADYLEVMRRISSQVAAPDPAKSELTA